MISTPARKSKRDYRLNQSHLRYIEACVADSAAYISNLAPWWSLHESNQVHSNVPCFLNLEPSCQFVISSFPGHFVHDIADDLPLLVSPTTPKACSFPAVAIPFVVVSTSDYPSVHFIQDGDLPFPFATLILRPWIFPICVGNPSSGHFNDLTGVEVLSRVRKAFQKVQEDKVNI